MDPDRDCCEDHVHLGEGEPDDELRNQCLQIQGLEKENSRLRITIQKVLGMIENGNTLLIGQAERACRDALTVNIK